MQMLGNHYCLAIKLAQLANIAGAHYLLLDDLFATAVWFSERHRHRQKNNVSFPG